VNRRLLVGLTIVAGAGSLAILLYPVASTALRVGLVVGLGAAWLGLLILWWSRRFARAALLSVPVVLTIPFLLPARPIERETLRRDYVERMTSLEGTQYVWGGESPLGIDCSGLPRYALRQALFSYGFRNLDGGSFRKGLELWWFDASARALGEGYRQDTTPLPVAGTLESMDYSELAPGDLAVTSDGAHVLAYAGGESWTQADPGIGAVATLNGRTGKNAWFRSRVTVHRWTVFGD